MTTIRATCPHCGEVDITPEAILLSLGHPTGLGSYRFSCPECLGTVRKPADRKVVALLLSAGVELEDAACEESLQPVEPMERRPGGPPFTVDDLISFRALLQNDEQLVRALQSG